MPKEEDFPYTVRLVSDILESNGSSSMATVCGGVLALMDAGVPLTMIPAGIALGLVKEGARYAILTDIAGYEDHFGDMDLKIPCLPMSILREAVYQSREARLEVLAKMKEVLPAPRPEISPYAPRIIIIFVNPEKVGEVIGPAGKIIKRIISTTGAKIDVEESGKICIASPDMTAAERARDMIREITAEAELGKIYTGKVKRIMEFGAFCDRNILRPLRLRHTFFRRLRGGRAPSPPPSRCVVSASCAHQSIARPVSISMPGAPCARFRSISPRR